MSAPSSWVTPMPARVLDSNQARVAAELKRRLYNRKALFPYSWTTPPSEAERVHAKGSIATPSANNTTEVLKYQVPANRFFWLTAIIQLYSGGNSNTLVVGDGHIAWDLDVNIPAGVTNSLQGYQVQGFSETLSAGLGNFPYGNFQGGLNSPYQLAKPELIGPEDTLRSKVTVDATPSGGRIVALFDGWLVPLELVLAEQRL